MRIASLSLATLLIASVGLFACLGDTDDAGGGSSSSTSKPGTGDVILAGRTCTPDPPGTVISGTAGGQPGAPYCPWNGCLDGPKAACGADGKWHCPTPSKTCAPPPADNDPACPATYSFTYQGRPCSSVGLTCAYPGAGDGLSDGTYATAMMWCRGPVVDPRDGGPDASADAGDADAGGDEPGTWTVAQ